MMGPTASLLGPSASAPTFQMVLFTGSHKIIKTGKISWDIFPSPHNLPLRVKKWSDNLPYFSSEKQMKGE